MSAIYSIYLSLHPHHIVFYTYHIYLLISIHEYQDPTQAFANPLQKPPQRSEPQHYITLPPVPLPARWRKISRPSGTSEQDAGLPPPPPREAERGARGTCTASGTWRLREIRPGGGARGPQVLPGDRRAWPRTRGSSWPGRAGGPGGGRVITIGVIAGTSIDVNVGVILTLTSVLVSKYVISVYTSSIFNNNNNDNW